MGRPRADVALFLGAALGVLAVGAASGCEAVLGVGDLSENSAGSGQPDATGNGHPFGGDASHRGDAAPLLDGRVVTGDEGHGGRGDDDADDDAEPPPSTNPSCVGSTSAATCGFLATGDCCSVDVVPGGSYYRTYDAGVTGGSDPATVSTFALDTYEVTVGRFRAYAQYLQTGGGPPAMGAGMHSYLPGGGLLEPDNPDSTYESGWLVDWNTNIPQGSGAAATWFDGTCEGTYTEAVGENENLPMTCVSWYEAYAFCIWDGGFLPSEAEWELAASGGGANLAFPWGSAAPDRNHATYACDEDGGCPTIVGETVDGQGLYGHFDLIGNVAEWTLDDFADYDTPCTDCAGYDTVGVETDDNFKVDRGGGFADNFSASYLSPQGRDSVTPDERAPYLGVRCARAPSP